MLGGISILVNIATQWHATHAVEFTSEPAKVALSILEGHGFSDPFLTGRSGPTAVIAPLYPYFYAFLCTVFGKGAAGWAAIVVLTSGVWALQWAYAYRFASAFGQKFPGLVAAFIGVIIPLQGRLFKWEGVFTGAALAYSAWALSQVLLRVNPKASAVRLGFGVGLTTLLCPSTILIWPFWAGLMFWRLGFARSVRAQVPAFLFMVVPVGAWTVRNWITFGHLFFVRDSVGLEMRIAYNDCSSPLLNQNLDSGCFAKENPSRNPAQLERLRTLGEIEFFGQDAARARSWIVSHPARTFQLTLAHFAYFWFPLDRSDKPALVYGILMSILTILSLMAVYWRSDGALILLMALVPFSAIYYLTQFEQRYRYPVLWISGVLAVVGVQLLVRRVEAGVADRQVSSENPMARSGD